MSDLLTTVGIDTASPITFVDLEGENFTLSGRKYPTAKGAVILQVFKEVADDLGLEAYWQEASEVVNKELEVWRAARLEIGPPPEDQSDQDALDDYVRRLALLPKTRSVFQVLYQEFGPKILNLLEAGPDAMFRIAALAMMPTSEMRQALKDGTFNDKVAEYADWARWEIDLSTCIEVVIVALKLSGAVAFLSKVLSLAGMGRGQGEATAEVTTTTETTETPTPIDFNEASLKRSSSRSKGSTKPR